MGFKEKQKHKHVLCISEHFVAFQFYNVSGRVDASVAGSCIQAVWECRNESYLQSDVDLFFSNLNIPSPGNVTNVRMSSSSYFVAATFFFNSSLMFTRTYMDMCLFVFVFVRGWGVAWGWGWAIQWNGIHSVAPSTTCTVDNCAEGSLDIQYIMAMALV